AHPHQGHPVAGGGRAYLDRQRSASGEGSDVPAPVDLFALRAAHAVLPSDSPASPPAVGPVAPPSPSNSAAPAPSPEPLPSALDTSPPGTASAAAGSEPAPGRGREPIRPRPAPPSLPMPSSGESSPETAQVAQHPGQIQAGSFRTVRSIGTSR